MYLLTFILIWFCCSLSCCWINKAVCDLRSPHRLSLKCCSLVWNHRSLFCEVQESIFLCFLCLKLKFYFILLLQYFISILEKCYNLFDHLGVSSIEKCSSTTTFSLIFIIYFYIEPPCLLDSGRLVLYLWHKDRPNYNWRKFMTCIRIYFFKSSIDFILN